MHRQKKRISYEVFFTSSAARCSQNDLWSILFY